jgi:hypothetical protein
MDILIEQGRHFSLPRFCYNTIIPSFSLILSNLVECFIDPVRSDIPL